MASSVGRNQICPCGSNKKYKKCCALKQGQMSLPMKISIAAISVILLGGMIIFISSIGDIDMSSQPSNRVWSEEHGHWHYY